MVEGNPQRCCKYPLLGFMHWLTVLKPYLSLPRRQGQHHSNDKTYIEVAAACLVKEVLHLALDDHDWLLEVVQQAWWCSGRAHASMVE